MYGYQPAAGVRAQHPSRGLERAWNSNHRITIAEIGDALAKDGCSLGLGLYPIAPRQAVDKRSNSGDNQAELVHIPAQATARRVMQFARSERQFGLEGRGRSVWAEISAK